MNPLQVVDLHDVEGYWKSWGLVDDRHLPYYVRWLQRFLAGRGGDSRLAPADAQRAFVEQLEREQVPEWQVGQAARAVELYQKHYLRFRQESAGDATGEAKSPDTAGRPATLDAAMNETCRLVRMRHYAYRTEQTYLGWLSQYGAFVQRRQLPWDAPDSARAFLGELAIQRGVAASTQNQAFCALLFLFREVLVQPLEGLQDAVRARRGPKLPVVFSRDEVQRLLAAMEGTTKLMAQLTCGAGLRLMECVRLRVKDLEFDQRLSSPCSCS